MIHPIYFAFDSSTITADSRDKLDQDASCIRQRNIEKLTVVGYCDPRGTEEYNLALGERRASSAEQFLKSLGVQADMQPRSMGEEMARGTDEASWAKDRRVELQVR